MQNQTHGEKQNQTFRGRSMQDAVNQLKEVLGPDAVIVSTRRGTDQQGRFVEITAAPQAAEAPQPVAVGGMRGASAAYQRTAKTTGTVERPSLLASAIRGSNSPFAERAAWLASQIQQRQATAPQASGVPAELMALRDGLVPSGQAHQVAPVQTQSVMQQAVATQPVPQHAVSAHGNNDEVVRLRTEIEELKSTVAQLSQPLASQPPPLPETDEDLNSTLVNLKDGIAEINSRLEEGSEHLESAASRGMEAELINAGISATHARELVNRVRKAIPEATIDDGDALQILEQTITDEMFCDDRLLPVKGQRRVLAFVGPTGVGKTTTIAKLASKARLDGLRVALITLDTFRLSAVQELGRYAEVLDAPMEVVRSPEGLLSALDKVADYDLVLVDTTGRNPRSAEELDHLTRYFPRGWGGQLILTVACSTRERDLFTAVDAFGRLGIDGLCVTKLDETHATGALYSLSRRAARPLVWVTDGQRIPDDVHVAVPTTLAREIVKSVSGRGGLALAG